MKRSVTLLFFVFIYLNISASAFRYIVATDGSGDFKSVQAAIDACPDNERSIIFIKNGTYYGQTSIGSKALASSKIISLIGESRDKVILTYDKSLNMVTTFEEATTFQIYAKNFYAENITLANTAGNTGQALALYTAGDMATFKNCYLTGYQDTYRSKKGTRGYFKSCVIEGAVDFIYAGGVEFFDDCKINCIKGGGYIVAPEDAYVTIPKTQTTIGQFIRVGFFFRNCTITRNSDVPDNTYALGRPWVASCGAVYLNCKMDKHIKAAGWQSWNGNETTSFFGEYNSMDLNGNLLDISGRVSWSYQLPKADVDNLLTPAAIYARVSSVTYDPVTLCIPTAMPVNVKLDGDKLSWDAVSGAAGYIVYSNGNYISNTNTTTVDLSTIQGVTYTVRAVGRDGVLSDPAGISTGTVTLTGQPVEVQRLPGKLLLSKEARVEMFTIAGKLVFDSYQLCSEVDITDMPKGIYILKLSDKEKSIFQNSKINIF